jgi:hypothetical protein
MKYIHKELYECRDEKKGGEAKFSPSKDNIRLHGGEIFEAE